MPLGGPSVAAAVTQQDALRVAQHPGQLPAQGHGHNQGKQAVGRGLPAHAQLAANLLGRRYEVHGALHALRRQRRESHHARPALAAQVLQGGRMERRCMMSVQWAEAGQRIGGGSIAHGLACNVESSCRRFTMKSPRKPFCRRHDHRQKQAS